MDWRRHSTTFWALALLAMFAAGTGVSVLFARLILPLPLVLTVFTVIWIIFWRKRMIHKGKIQELQNNNNALLEDIHVPDTIKAFTHEALVKATEGFSRIVGRGGFGSVYRGTLPDGTAVAVKALPHDGNKESFEAEVAAMSALNHNNLVRLIGVCPERFHRMLVYEFMENSSLDQWIFSTPERRRHLDWKTRRSIALDAAKGLAYLHDDSRSCVLHLDIKPENILLDDALRAKISDFGLAKTLKRELESRWVTTRMRGTPGYMAPEWLYKHGVTAKSDVFGFGVVLLEMICGRRCVDNGGNENCRGSCDCSWYLPSMVFEKAHEGSLQQLLDPAVEAAETKEMEEIFRLIWIALWCVQGNPGMRPSMRAVVSMIQSDLPVKEPPFSSNIPFAPSSLSHHETFEWLSATC